MSETVEDVARRFLDAWVSRDIQAALGVMQTTYVDSTRSAINKWRTNKSRKKPPLPPETLAQKIAGRFKLNLDSYEIVSMASGGFNTMRQPVVMVARVEGVSDGRPLPFTMRLICESAPYMPRADGTWGVNLPSIRFMPLEEMR